MCSTCGCAEGNLYIEGDEHRPHSAFRSAPFSPAPRPSAALTGITFAPQRSAAGDLHYGHGEAGTHAPGISHGPWCTGPETSSIWANGSTHS